MAAPTITVVSPAEGSVVARNTQIVVDVVADVSVGSLRRCVLSARLSNTDQPIPVEELVHDGIAFSAAYTGGANNRSSITRGYRFTLCRVGGWRGSQLTLQVIAVDVAGNVAQKTLAVPQSLYVWPLAGS
jgi:hypothetical protein